MATRSRDNPRDPPAAVIIARWTLWTIVIAIWTHVTVQVLL